MKEIFRQGREAAEAKLRGLRLESRDKALGALRVSTRAPEAYLRAARCHAALHEYDAALEILREGI